MPEKASVTKFPDFSLADIRSSAAASSLKPSRPNFAIT
jgi:hypothetical protein